jgi:Leucine-rich repeat (LRR) protein
VSRGVKSKEKTVRCEAYGWWDGDRRSGSCTFERVTFTQDTKLNIERIGHPELTDEDFDEIRFEGSAISLVHPDILRKFPNIKRIVHWSELQNQDKLENCMNITDLSLFLLVFAGISSNTFADCKSLMNLGIESSNLTILPDGLFINQRNLQALEFRGRNIKLRVNAFEGLQSLSILRLAEVSLYQTEENFFHKLRIKRLEYKIGGFPIELIKSHETLEELSISFTRIGRLSEDFFAILRTLKLRTLDLYGNEIAIVESVVDLPNVERIYLFGNEIKELPANSFSGCPRLTYLNIGRNPISSLRGNEFNMLSGLKELYLDELQLTSIAPNTFHPLKSLVVLDMRLSFKGDMVNIEKELFMKSANLKWLLLSNNKIHAIHPESFDNLKGLNRIDLRSNKCVDKSFWAQQNETLDMNIVKASLKTCFENYLMQQVNGDQFAQ